LAGPVFEYEALAAVGHDDRDAHFVENARRIAERDGNSLSGRRK